jgi:hypothetical protein
MTDCAGFARGALNSQVSRCEACGEDAGVASSNAAIDLLAHEEVPVATSPGFASAAPHVRYDFSLETIYLAALIFAQSL